MAVILRWTVFALLYAFVLASPTPNITRAASTKCKLPGLFCLDCNSLSVCVEIGGQFLEYQMSSCPDSNPCSHSLRECSTKKSHCLTDPQRFLCQHTGIFPDPYDCNVYHECRTPSYPDEPDYAPYATSVCEVGTSYNSGTGKCDLPDTYPACRADTYPVEECGSGLSGGPVPLNPNYYWMCLDTVIRIFQCQENYVFNKDLLRCIREGEEPTEAPTTASPAAQCPDTGRQPDPDNCYRYFDCTDVTKPVRVACPLGMYYHRRKKLCLLGFCPY